MFFICVVFGCMGSSTRIATRGRRPLRIEFLETPDNEVSFLEERPIRSSDEKKTVTSFGSSLREDLDEGECEGQLPVYQEGTTIIAAEVH
mmetsp:Transcript_6705/g.8306  ORF Transcript_6705/g.8306 Transcript_6705/m.8306 type:complete len:90 (-) Transcript_6705:91-360(-)